MTLQTDSYRELLQFVVESAPDTNTLAIARILIQSVSSHDPKLAELMEKSLETGLAVRDYAQTVLDGLEGT